MGPSSPCIAGAVAIVVVGAHAMTAEPPVPDLTQGGKRDQKPWAGENRMGTIMAALKSYGAAAAAEAIEAIEAATEQPKLRSIAPLLRRKAAK